jgi:hypothetical protein
MARQRTQTVRQKAKREHQKTVSGAASSGLCETSEMQTSDGWKRGNGKQRTSATKRLGSAVKVWCDE